MVRTKSWLVGGLTIGFTLWMASSASAQLFRRSESREQRYQTQPQYQSQPQYQRGEVQRGEVRYEGSDRYSQSSQSTSHNRNRRISTVIGATARGPNGELLGRVEDLVASESGCIDYAIVSFSGVPGLGNKVAAIPWMMADLDMSQRVVTLDIERERIRQAPIFFDRNNWPDLYDRDWTERVSDFFGVEVASDSREHGSDRGRSESRASKSRAQDQSRDRYESRSYGRPESDSERDRFDSRSRRSSDREQSEYRSSRRSQEDDNDRDRQQSRSSSRSSGTSRYQDQDSDRDEDARSSRGYRSDDDDSNSSRNNNSKKNNKNDNSDDSDDDRPK